MKHITEFRQWYSIFAKYSIITIAALAIFLFSGILTSGVVVAHTVMPQSTMHVRQHAISNTSSGTLLWKYLTGGSGSFSASDTPVIAAGVVYYVSANGSLSALNANTGALLWQYQVTSSSEPRYSAAVVNGTVYFSANGYVYALNASNGSLLWQYLNGSSLTSAPTVASGILYIDSANGSFIALNANNGTLLWSCSCGSSDSQAVVTNGTVYVSVTTSSENTNYIDALNANSGALLWQYQSGTPINYSGIYAAPTVVNGIVYASLRDGYLYALNATNGSLDWRFQTGTYSGSPINGATVEDGVVYTSGNFSSASYLYALNASTGSLLWQYEVNNHLITSPVALNGVVYAASFSISDEIYALNANDGSSLWSYQISDASNISTPAVANGIVYFGASDSYVYAVTAPSPVGPQGAERLGGSNPSELGQCTSCAGDPIDTYSGNFSHSWTDFSIPGRGIPLLFSRTYNAQATAQKGLFGYGWTDSYNLALTTDSSGNVTIQQEDGSTVTFAPNGSNGYTAPPRVLATLVQNSDGTYTFTRANQLQYVFNSSGQLAQEVDRNGYKTDLTYNVSHQLTTVTDPAGRSLTFGYGSNGLIAQITDPINRTVAFQYDTSNNLTAATDVNGGVTHFTYDANRLLLTMTDPNGGAITNAYDGSARVISQTDAMNRKTTFSYGKKSTTTTDPNGNVTVEQYQNGLLTSRTKGSGTAQAATWSYAYDPLSLGQISIKDPDGHVWTKTWDASGNLLSVTDPLKHTTVYTYDIHNDLTSLTDPLGVTTTYTYDANGNLLSVSTPLTGAGKTQTTTYTYGDSSHPGDVTAMTDPDGKTWSYTYDANGNRISASDPLGEKTTFQYNGIGWKTAQTTPKGNSTSYTYTPFGDVAQVTDPLGHTTTSTYDANRNLIKTTDAAGHITRYTYDADNEVTKVIHADSSTQTYSYDGDGNRTGDTDGLGHKTTYTYGDPAFPGSITATTDALGHTTSYGYDKAGNRISLTNPANQTTSYTYNTANELTKVAYSDGKTHTVTFTYDGDGQRLSMTDSTGKTTYSYNSLHQLIKATNGARNAVSYGYDLKGQLISLIYPGKHKVIRTYDVAGRLTSVKDWLGSTTNFAYDADSNLVIETYPNGVQATLQYDRDDRLLSIADSLSGNTFLSFTYTRNALSLLASLQSQGTSQGNETYSYTALNQVSAVNQLTYQYDHGDNLTQNGAATLSYNAGNELTSLINSSGTTTYSYDSQGNRTQATAPGNAVTNYTYDQANQLTGYSSGSTTAQYAYNGDGLRMSKTIGSTSEAFTWDIAEGLPLLLQDGTTNYVYGPSGLLLAQITGSTVYYYHQDQLGSTRVLTGSTGTVIATYTYDAYGNTTAHTGSVTTPFQYAGQYTDAESGLQYLRARFYDPATGQFLTPDPLVILTQQLYAYAGDDPLNAIDPGGKDWINNTLDFIGLAAGLVGVVAAIASLPEDATAAVAILATAEIIGDVAAVLSTAYTIYQYTQGKASLQDVAVSLGFTAITIVTGSLDRLVNPDFLRGIGLGDALASIGYDFSQAAKAC